MGDRTNNLDPREALFEGLEPRRLLSAEVLPSGTLWLTGTTGDDAIQVEGTGVDGQVRVFGVPGVADGELFSDIRRVRAELDDGNDTFEVLGRIENDLGKRMAMNIFGRRGDDTLIGGDTRDNLVGGPGDDLLIGKQGNDRLSGGNGSDELRGGDGNDTLIGGDGQDLLLGQNGRDDLFGGDKIDILRGGRGQDILRGNNGDDTLEGGKGTDDLFGGRGTDRVFGDEGFDFFRGQYSEWLDHGENDDFHSPLLSTRPELVNLPDSLWDVVDTLDANYAGKKDLPFDVWIVLDAAQQMWSSVGESADGFIDLFNLLPQGQQDTLETAITDAFLAEIRAIADGTFSSYTFGDLQGFVNDVRTQVPALLLADYITLTNQLLAHPATDQLLFGLDGIAKGSLPNDFTTLLIDTIDAL
ncbi:MAG: calcium-binding protein [Phycisphaerales bacterium JB037]